MIRDKSTLRILLKQNHPDRGGDPEVYRKLLEEYDSLSKKGSQNAFDAHVERVRKQAEIKKKRDNMFKV